MVSVVSEDGWWILINQGIWLWLLTAGWTRPEAILLENDAAREICGDGCESAWIQPNSHSLYVAGCGHANENENAVENYKWVAMALASVTLAERDVEYGYPTSGEVNSNFVPCRVQFRG